jgi:hypothetical protein
MRLLQKVLNGVWPMRWAYFCWVILMVLMVWQAGGPSDATVARMQKELEAYKVRCDEKQGMVVSNGQSLLCVRADATIEVEPPKELNKGEK